MEKATKRPSLADVFAFLDLVDSPLTERDAQALSNEPAFEESARSSDVYMVGARPAAFLKTTSGRINGFKSPLIFGLVQDVLNVCLLIFLKYPAWIRPIVNDFG